MDTNDEKPCVAFGVDLGTETTSASVMIENKLETVMIDGQKSIRSCVYLEYGTPQTAEVAAIKDEMERFKADTPKVLLVGSAAAENALLKANLVTNPKSLVGRDFADPHVQQLAKKSACQLVKGGNGEVEIEIEGRRHTPQFFLALILLHVQKAVKQHVEAKMAMGDIDVREMAIGIPANFGARPRKRILQATVMAGLFCHRLLNEPTAVAFAYIISITGGTVDFHLMILILDLGGGTFDPALLEYKSATDEMVVRDKAGDNDLGGVHMTAALTELLIAKHGKAAPLSAEDRHKVFAAAEAAKRKFTDEEVDEQEVRWQIGSKVCKVKINRKEFRRALAPFLDRLNDPIDRLKTNNPAEWAKLECVIPMGQATRLPEVRDAFTRFVSGKKLLDAVDLETAVSAGVAAWVAGQSTHHFKNDVTKFPEPRDVTAFDLGVKEGESHMAVMVKRNTLIPHNQPVTKEFFFPQKKDGSFKNDTTIQIFEGNSPYTHQNTWLGKLRVRREPKRVELAESIDAKDLHRIEVTFKIDISNVITVTALVSNGDKFETTFDGAVDEEEEVAEEDGAEVAEEEGEIEGEGTREPPAQKLHSGSSRLAKMAAAINREITFEMGSGSWDFDRLQSSQLVEAQSLTKLADGARDKGQVTQAKYLYLKAGYIYSCLPDDSNLDGFELVGLARTTLKNAQQMVRREKAGVGQSLEYFECDIAEGEAGWDYDRLFHSLLNEGDFTTVVLEDPYIYQMHQMRKLNMIIELFIDRVPSFERFYLITHRDKKSHTMQANRFAEMSKSFAQYTDTTRESGIQFEVAYEDTFHDRVLNNDSGWKMNLGSGIDIFRPYMRYLGVGATNVKNLRTRACTNTFFKLADLNHFNRAFDKFEQAKRAERGWTPPAKMGRFSQQTTNDMGWIGGGGAQSWESDPSFLAGYGYNGAPPRNSGAPPSNNSQWHGWQQ